MNQDIKPFLEDWDYKPGVVQARMVQTPDRRHVIQMRVDLGILQMETAGRPDGARPHSHASYWAYLKDQARMARRQGKSFVMSEEQCQEADREFVQFYHRRICWLALRHYDRAVEDADHTLTFMDFVQKHSPSDEYTHAHEQYRGFVIFQRTQAAAALQVEKSRPEGAIDEIRAGLERLRGFFAAFDMEDQMDEDGMVQHLRKVESSLRQEYNIDATLQEQLEKAVADENYEKAARLRDELKRRE
ncbi:MAG: UvrB/UvrC motif-containing protein [Planctomycetes bacterium]|nr:UvrB/UvrC motif-containing protein [Planctomycetota bacterium]